MQDTESTESSAVPEQDEREIRPLSAARRAAAVEAAYILEAVRK